MFLEELNKQSSKAYQQLYKDYYRVLVLYAQNFLSTQESAEDIVQQLFITMWEKQTKFLSLPSLRVYLYNAVRNASLNYLKRENVEARYIEQLVNTFHEFTDEEDTLEEELYQLLYQTIDKLPNRCRAVFLLHMEGKRNDEIAEALEISVGTVKTQKKRAMRFIREQMGIYFHFLLALNIL